MNVLFVSSEFPLKKNQATGGIGTYLLNLTSELVKQGHKVTVLTKQTGANRHKNIKVVFCNLGNNFLSFLRKILPFPPFQRVINFIEYPLLISLGVYLRIKRIDKEQKIDIIEGNDFGGELFFYLLLEKKRPPVVLRLHTPSFVIRKFNNEPNNLFYRVMKFLEVFCLKKADSLYSPTRSLAKIVEEEIKRPVKTIIPYPFKPLYHFSNIKRKNNLVLYVGKLQPKKGVFLLAETIPYVLKELPNTFFYFVGPDTLQDGVSVKSILRERLERAECLKNIRFMGELDKRQVYRLYQQATVLIIPSLWENFPNVVLEAMSQDLPIVASNSGGLKEIIKHKKNGFLMLDYKSSFLSQAILELLTDKKLRLGIANRAKNYLEKLSNVRKISKKTIEFYSKKHQYIIGNNEIG